MSDRITKTARGELTIHSYTASESGWGASSHLLEYPQELQLVDVPFTSEGAQRVLQLIEDVDKPLSRVIITHAHPDHYATLGLFDAPSYALASTRDSINARGTAIRGGAYALSGYVPPIDLPAPTVQHVLEVGEVRMAGEQVVFNGVPRAETAEQLTIAWPQRGVILTGDLVYDRTHAFLADRHFDGWLTAIAAIEAGRFEVILPGHGRPGGPELLSGMRDYVLAARQILAEVSTAEELNKRLVDAFPDFVGAGILRLQNYYLFPPG